MLNNWTPVSLPISEEMVVYKDQDDKRPLIETTRTFASHGMHESSLHLPLHTGTHVDYPLHALEGGKCSSDYRRFPLTFLALVVDLTPAPHTTIALDQVRDLALEGVEAVLFKTMVEPAASFDPQFPGLTSEAAAWLAGKPLFSHDAAPVPLPRHRVQDIDTAEDWERAEWLFKAMQSQTGQA